MAAVCAYCQRPVYPTEQIRILGRRLHRACFRCSACGASLSLRSFTSREGAPFCAAHAPPLTPSSVVDTPLMQVAARSQQLVSPKHYQKDLDEVVRGHGLAVADDVQMLRARKAGTAISDVEYTGTLRRKKNMEERRKTTELVRRQSMPYGTTALLYNAASGRPVTFATAGREVGSIADFDPYRAEGDQPPIHTLTKYVAGSSHWGGDLVYHSDAYRAAATDPASALRDGQRPTPV